MKTTVDARNQACPKPVIMTKKGLDQKGVSKITTIVDNEVAKENVSKLVNSLGYEFSVEKKDEDYYIHIDKGSKTDESKSEAMNTSNDLENMTIAFSSDKMGSGDEQLGEILMKSFIYTVSETKPYPSSLIFYNAGVKLTCKGSKVIEDLKKLKDEGVEIISCGTCLDFLNLKDQIEIGSISNMYTIYEKLKDVEKNIIIG